MTNEGARDARFAATTTATWGLFAAVAIFAVGATSESPRTTSTATLMLAAVSMATYWIDRRNAYPLIAFVGCYTLFLVSRQSLNTFLGAPSGEDGVLGTGAYSDSSLNYTNFLLFLGLVGLLIGWLFAGSRGLAADRPISAWAPAAVKVGSVLLILSAPAQIYMYWHAAQTIADQGFFTGRLSAAAAPMPIRVMSATYDLSFFLLLAGRPTKRVATAACGIYVAVSAMSLLTLVRSDFILSTAFIALYVYHRQVSMGESWFSRNRILAAVLGTPLLLVLMNSLGAQRGRDLGASSGLFAPIVDFVRSQGVSVRVVVASHELSSSIPSDRWYSIGALYESGQRILSTLTGTSTQALQGQTATRAIDGHQFSHTISYLIAPYDYVQGVGYGSSYIAELFVDFGIAGVVVGSALYGLSLGRAQRFFSGGVLSAFVALYAIKGVLFVPRASFVQPFADLVSLPSLIALPSLAILVWITHLASAPRGPRWLAHQGLHRTGQAPSTRLGNSPLRSGDDA